jgi:type I pantothenate kinase
VSGGAPLTGAAEAVAAAVRAVTTSPVLVGIGGSVAVGKTTLAEQVATVLAPGLRTAVLATDCFLLPNDELARRGMLMQKGFPESYDADAIGTFLAAAERRDLAEVPIYSHATYDRLPGVTATIGPADVYVIEGVNALQPPLAGRLAVAVYLDADENDIRRWYVDRFLRHIEVAEDDDSSFYRRFVPLDGGQRQQMAESTWDGINAVNLHEHIEPTRAAATLVLRKSADHTLQPA